MLRAVIDAVPSAFICVDEAGRIEFCNAEARKLSVIECDELYGLVVSEALPLMKPRIELVRRAIESRRIQTENDVTATVNGVTRLYKITVFPRPAPSEGCRDRALIRADEITDTKSIEAVFQPPEGVVPDPDPVASVAHEINNYLAAILQNVQVIRNRIVEDIPKNRRAAEECGTTLEKVKAYIEKRDIVPMINAVIDSSLRAAKSVSAIVRGGRKNGPR